ILDCSLKRVGPNRRKQFILYDTINTASKVKFIEWWCTTENFDQVAYHITGEPLVIYRTCGVTLPYLSTKQSGTNTLKRYLALGKCQKGGKRVTYNSRYLTTRYEALNRPRLLDIAFLVGIYGNYRNYRELLLGFEPLNRAHSGVNLSEVLIEIFKKLDITNRVLAITSDNASNNTTLVQAVPVVVRIPYLTHVIQLSLRELLRSIGIFQISKPKPKLDRSSEQVIVQTLIKIRGLAILINTSPQRRDDFFRLQTNRAKLAPIQDIRTRWNSTFLMLRRTKRLSKPYDKYYDNIGTQKYKLKPFYRFTTVLSKTKEITKKAILQALNARIAKLTSYYTKTKEINGSLYAIRTILTPQHKLHFFSSKLLTPKDTLRHGPYEKSNPPKRHLASTSDLDTLLDLLPHIHSNPSSSEHELTRYLKKPRRRVDPLQFWKEYKNKFLILSSVTRDILSIPAIGAGVKRLFNLARDVYHYRRRRLSAKTVQDIMMFRCKTQFDIKIEELPDKDISLDSIQEADEQREAKLTTDIPKPISDGKDSEDNDPIGLIEHKFMIESQLPRPSIVLSTRKQQRSELVDSEDESSPYLPYYGDKGSTQKRPGLREARKRGKPNNDQFVSY
ncbi:HAT dimerization, partial [Penicillium coprophilum]|uniref:HAT dimerization n=1 Tax=Penicillium coprophilum TaxID=36646 RepID=UPI0023970585